MWMVRDFSQTIFKYTEGEPDYEELLQDINDLYDHFKGNVWSTAPRFVPFTHAELRKTAGGSNGDGQPTDLPSAKRIALGKNKPVAHSKGSIDIDEVKEETLGPSGVNSVPMSLDEVREIIQK